MKKTSINIIASVGLILGMLGSTNISISAQEQQSVRIMPLGDSITDGFTTEGGYRVPLCNLLEANGYSQYVDFVGPNTGGKCYDNEHAGYSGYTIEDVPSALFGSRTGIASFTGSLIDKYKPDIVMLQIGTNDISVSVDLNTLNLQLEKLADNIISLLPEDGMLYIATIPYMDISFFGSTDTNIDKYNQQVKNLVVKKQNEGKNVKLADIHSVVPKNLLTDGVHPSEKGYQAMGEYWYNILSTDILSQGQDTPVLPLSGDIDQSGTLNAKDLTMMIKYFLNSGIMTESQIRIADTNNDNTINILDIISLKNKILEE